MNKVCAALLVLTLPVIGCAMQPRSRCAVGSASMIDDTLYLGTAKPAGVVRPEEWDSFVAEVVTPKFPRGFTVWQTSGQWRSADGTIVREDSRVLVLIHPADDERERAVRDIVSAYKSRFQQEAVLRLSTIACTSFD